MIDLTGYSPKSGKPGRRQQIPRTTIDATRRATRVQRSMISDRPAHCLIQIAAGRRLAWRFPAPMCSQSAGEVHRRTAIFSSSAGRLSGDKLKSGDVRGRSRVRMRIHR